MRLERRIGLFVWAALALAGCGVGGGSGDAEPRPRYEYVAAVRPLAYANAHEACAGHSLTSLAYEYGVGGTTLSRAARDWARRNQRDDRLREASYRGCLDALVQTARMPVWIDPADLTDDEIAVYIGEYSTCRGQTVAEIAKEFGVDARGLTPADVVWAAVRRSYGEAYRRVAYEACLAAVRGEAPRYGW